MSSYFILCYNISCGGIVKGNKTDNVNNRSIKPASFSKNKKILIAAALLNAATALKLTHMKWIRFQRTLTSGLARNVSTATPTFHFMIPNPEKMLPDASAYQDTLTQIYDYTTTFFDEAEWNVYWQIFRNQYGSEVSRTLMFDAKISPRPLNINGLNFYELIASWGGKATQWNGTKGKLNINV